MIAVIADDLTGAAEIGGLALHYQLTVEIATEVNRQSAPDLLIIATDTRSVSEEEAKKITATIAAQLSSLKPSLIFKKIDSVLRGHVLAEINVLLKALGLNKALIVPANPSLGRTIVNGVYYFNGQPVHLSSYSKDPEFAITNSDVTSMLRSNHTSVKICKPTEPLPDEGIVVGEASCKGDLNAWALLADASTLLVGGGDFFNAIIEQTQTPLKEVENNMTAFNDPILFVCGTAFHKSVASIQQIKQDGGPVSYMPLAVLLSEQMDAPVFEEWSDEIVALININGKAIVAIDNEVIKGIRVSALSLRQKMAVVIKKALEKKAVKELFIEGGSTAAAIIRDLHVNRFYPTHELVRGVTRMKVEGKQDLYITLKPGSYNWPPGINF